MHDWHNAYQKERLFCMIAYLPKATVQAAIGSVPLAMGLACGQLVLTVAVVAILITAPLGRWVWSVPIKAAQQGIKKARKIRVPLHAENEKAIDWLHR